MEYGWNNSQNVKLEKKNRGVGFMSCCAHDRTVSGCCLGSRDGDMAALAGEKGFSFEQMDHHKGDWRNTLFYKYTASHLESELSFTP